MVGDDLDIVDARAVVPKVEAGTYQAIVDAVAAARAQRASGVDPTGGARHFNFRGSDSRSDFQGHPIHTQSGPLSNSYPTTGKGGLPANGVYSNTYADLGSGWA